MKMKRILKSFRGGSGGKHHPQNAAVGAGGADASGTEDLTGISSSGGRQQRASLEDEDESVQYPANYYGDDDDIDNFSLYTDADNTNTNKQHMIREAHQKVYGEVESYFASTTNNSVDDGTALSMASSTTPSSTQQQKPQQQQSSPPQKKKTNSTATNNNNNNRTSRLNKGKAPPPKTGTKGTKTTTTTVRIPPPPSGSSSSTAPPTSNASAAAADRHHHHHHQPIKVDRSAETRHLVKKYIADIWNRGELELIPAVCSPALRINGNTGFDRVGHDGLARMVHQIRDVLAEYHCEIHSMVVEDNKCFCRLRFMGKHVGVLNGYPPTHKTVAWMGAAEYTCQNGKILKVWEMGDMKSLEQQLRGSDKEEEEKKSNGI